MPVCTRGHGSPRLSEGSHSAELIVFRTSVRNTLIVAPGGRGGGRAEVHMLYGGKTHTAHIRPELGTLGMRGSKPAGFSGVGERAARSLRSLRRSQRQRCRLTWRPPQVKLHRLHQAAVAPSPHRQARAWPKSTRSCPRAERVHHRRRRRMRRRHRSTCKLSRRGWCTREDTERSTSLSSLPPSPRLSGSSTHGRITVAGPHAPALPARHTARRCMSSADDPPLGARAGSPTRRRRSSSSSSRTSR